MTYLEQNLCLTPEERSATATLDWFAHRNNPLSEPRPAGNIVEPLICGEEAFGKFHACIERASKSIDIISWGFDPGLRLKRSGSRQETLGELLKRKSEQGVEVRVLIWNNSLAQLGENSVIGEGWSGRGGTGLGSGIMAGQPADVGARAEKRQLLLEKQQQERSRLERLPSDDEPGRRASRDRLIAIQQELDGLDGTYLKGSDSGGTAQQPEDQAKARDWYRWVYSGAAKHIEFRTRDYPWLLELSYSDEDGLRAHWGRLVILGKLIGRELPDTSWMQYAALSLFPSHHQKTLVIDYLDPERAEGMVMGHNLQRNYWDTTAHAHDDATGRRDPGFGPWQDLSLHVRGPVLFDLNHNFCNAWDNATSWIRRLFSGTLAGQRAGVRPLGLIRNDGEAAQICRTQAQEGGETTILEIYEKALGNVHQYAYIENQYFRYPPLAERLKSTAAQRKAAGACNDLHLFVVTNTPDNKNFSSKTYEMLDSLGQAELMPLAHRDYLYDQRQLVYRERELASRPASAERDLELANIEKQKRQHDIDEARADELTALDPNAHYNKAAARELEPEMLPPEGLKVIVATLVSCDSGTSAAQATKNQAERQTDQQIGEALGPEQGTTKYKPIYVHSKLLLVDDLFFTLGSANINTRSLHSDSELNIAMPSPRTTRLWRERLWEIHSREPIKPSIENDFDKWENAIRDNWENQKGNPPLIGNLVRFWDLVTPYATSVD
ncbi:phospholipase D-like domain-containing protein [Geopseudomonas aromaticivorans]